MKKFYSLLGAFAVAALGAVSTTAADVPTDLLTVSPNPGESYQIANFPTSFTFNTASYSNRFAAWDNDASSYVSTLPADAKIKVTFPDNEVLYYTPQASGYFAINFTVPSSVVSVHGTGVITFEALMQGMKMQNGTVIPDFTWTYTITDGSGGGGGETPGVGVDDYGMPGLSKICTSYSGTLLPSDGVMKDGVNCFDIYFDSTVTIQSRTKITTKLYKKVGDVYSQAVNNTFNFAVDARNRNIYWSGSTFDEAGEYRMVFEYSTAVKVGSSEVTQMSFDFSIPDKAVPDPVAATYEFTPADGSSVNVADFNQQIVITYTNAASLSGYAYKDNLTITAPDGSSVEVPLAPVVNGKTVTFNNIPVPTMNGKYKCSFKPSSILKGVTEEGAELIIPSNTEWSFTVTGNKADVPADITITPAQGNAVQADFASGVIKVAYTGAMAIDARNGIPTLVINDNEPVKANENSQVIQDYFSFNVPASVFANGGTFDVEFKLNGASWFGKTAPESFNWTWTLPEPAALPALKVDGVAAEGDAIEVAEGAEISFGEVAEGTVIYYKWTAAASTVLLKAPAEGYAEYTEPIVVNEAGTLSYYAENAAGASEIKTVNVTVKSESALPAGIEDITPAPGSTVDDTLTEIVFTFNADQQYAQMLSNVGEATLAINGGTPISATGTANANQSVDGKIKFTLTSDVKWKDGENTVVFTRNGFKPAMGNNYIPETYTFTYLYKAPVVYPEGVQAISPDPAEKLTSAPQAIEITFNADQQYAQMLTDCSTAVLTINGKEISGSGSINANQSTDGVVKFIIPEDFAWKAGENTVVFTRNSARPMMGNNYIPDTFSFVYDVDTSVAIEGIELEVAADYYTVEGIKVQNPEAGKLYIKVANGKASKVIIR